MKISVNQSSASVISKGVVITYFPKICLAPTEHVCRVFD